MLSQDLVEDMGIMVSCACKSVSTVQKSAKANRGRSVHQRSVEISKKIQKIAFRQV